MLFKRQDKIGDFTVISPIKEGSYAETYRVKDSLGKKKFLKLVPTSKLRSWQIDDNGNIIEFEVSKNLKHHNLNETILTDNIIINGQKYSYLVKEFLANETLAESIERGKKFDVYEIKKISKALLSALKYLHEQSRPIIHNEVTIQNIILNLNTENLDDIKLIDFGYSRFLDMANCKQPLEDLNIFYQAPERFAGVSCVQSDLFAVGVCIYVLLYGKLPWFFDISRKSQQENLEKLAKLRELPLYIPDEDIFELDEQFINTIKRALLPDAENRFSSADEFISAIDGNLKIENPDKFRQAKFSGESKNKNNSNNVAKPKDGEGFSAIAGMHELKDLVTTEVIDAINQREEYERYGVTVPNGMLLYGPPGCGKLFLQNNLLQRLDLTF